MTRFRPTDLRGAIVLFVPLAVTGFVAALLAYGADLNPVSFLLGRRAEVEVPDVVGENQPRAVVEIQQAGFTSTVEFVVSLNVPRGVVVSQSPEAGARIPSGDPVVLRVSRGNSRVVVPDPGDRAAGPFLTTLEATGLVVERLDLESETVPEGRIIGLDPPPGSVVDGGSTVRALVSTGPAPREVPEVAGRSLNGAAFLVGDAGLQLGEVTRRDDPEVPAGAVITSDPAPGTSVPRDTPVALVVSDGPPPMPVPDVRGRREVEAARGLETAGFVVLRATQDIPPGDRRDGAVLGVLPEPGTPLRPGQVVTISVGRVPPPPPTTVPPTTAPPSTTTPATSAPATSAPPTSAPVSSAPEATRGGT